MSFLGAKLGIKGAVERVPLLCCGCKYSSFCTPASLYQSVSLLCCLVNILPSCVITAECPVLSHAAAGPAPDAEGGGGQREVQEENPHPHTSSSLAPLCAFSGRDPTVSPSPIPASQRTHCSTLSVCAWLKACLCVTCRCFRPVSRTEAEVLLERHPDCGNMLLRPGRDGCSLAVTTRQDLNG